MKAHYLLPLRNSLVSFYVFCGSRAGGLTRIERPCVRLHSQLPQQEVRGQEVREEVVGVEERGGQPPIDQARLEEEGRYRPRRALPQGASRSSLTGIDRIAQPDWFPTTILDARQHTSFSHLVH